MSTIQELLLLVIPILYALTIHEVAHGWVALRLGDPTAKYAGRLTLNPLKHLDPIGTLMLFIAKIGWAKPVPVNPMYLRNPTRDMALVALAGPTSNFLSAFVFGQIYRVIQGNPVLPYLDTLVFFFVYINLILGFFNLIPLAPLDGWRILSYVLPREPWVYTLERSGPILLLIVIVMPMFLGINLLGMVLSPLMQIGLHLTIGG